MNSIETLARHYLKEGAPETLWDLKDTLQEQAELRKQYADQIETACNMYTSGSDDNVEIDDDPMISEGEDGIWVQAWVWVPVSSEAAQ